MLHNFPIGLYFRFSKCFILITLDEKINLSETLISIHDLKRMRFDLFSHFYVELCFISRCIYKGPEKLWDGGLPTKNYNE